MFGDNLFERFGKVFRSGEIICCEYEPGDDFFMIQSGQVRIAKVVSDKEKTLDVLESGDIFGEMAILEQQPRSATAIAQGDVKVLVFNRQNFEMLLKSNPDIAIKLLKNFSKRIYDAKRQLMVLTFPEPDLRLADVFCIMAEKMGYTGDDVKKVELTISKENLLNMTGLAEKDLTKVLENFLNSNKVTINGDKMIITNIKELERLVNTRRKQRNSASS